MKTKLITGLITIVAVLLSINSFCQPNKWLYFPINTTNNRIDIGDLSVSGSSITVEALIVKQISSPPAYYNIVSKHFGQVDCNYLLRPADFEVTTSSGFTTLANPFALCFDSTYHVAATYDGDTIKYFLNGVRVASKHWTGTLVQNAHTTGIGNMSSISAFYEQFIGYIDEVRIWNVARTQAQIAGNMYNLPNPTTQTGLLGYYKFDGNYNNIQGNSAYNGVPVGTMLRDTINTLFDGSVSNPTANVSVTISATNTSVCSGTPVTFSAVPLNGGSSPVYQWKVNGNNAGTNSPNYTYTPSNGDVVTCRLTSSLACATNNPATSNQIVMIVSSTLPVSVTITCSANPYCEGTSVTYTATPVNGGTSPAYQWKVNGSNVGSNSPSYTYFPVNGDIVTCMLASNVTCPSGNPAISNPITMTEIPNSPVSVSINASANPVCSVTLVTYTATPTNGGTIPFYQWKVNGSNSGTNSTSFIYTPLNNDVVTCELTSSLTDCISNNPATSNAITMIVNPALPVSVGISASANPVCSGTSVSFTATPVNGGSTPVYQWMVNSLPVGTNNPVYTYVPLTGDVVTCTLTSDALCSTGSPATSAPVTMIVNANMPVNVSISASSNPFCQGSTVTFTAMPTNSGSTPAYQWKVNGINAGTNSSSYSYIPNNGNVVSCVLNSNIACPIGNPANSNVITMIQNNTVPVNVSIAASSNPVCAGTSVTFTAIPANGGGAPVYQWKLNGSNTGTNSPTYSYLPATGDIVTCTLTSNAACASGNPATSNSVTMTVNPNLPVSISVSASANPVCAGTSVTYTATPVNGGSSPSYQWFVNSNPVGMNSPTYSYIPNNGDLVSSTLTSSAICAINNPATSNQQPVSVNPNMPVSVTITASANPICSGVSVIFTAIPTNGGSTPVYQWKVNGTNVGTSSATYTYNPVAGEQVNCILTSNIVCPTGNPGTSNTITMNVAALAVVTFPSCFDTITTVNAKPIKLKGGIPLGGTYSGPGVNSLTSVFSPSLAGGGTHTITYSYTNASLCTAAMTRTINVLSAQAFICGNNLSDIRDGRSYPTVQIGTQCWMAANLNFGSMIPSNTAQRDNCTWEKYCYNDLLSNCGSQAYYQWDELMRYDETPAQQGICPPAWHIPTENEWNTLFLNWTNNAFAGAPLKYSGYSGYNALLYGADHLNVQWDYAGFASFFWSSTPRGNTKAWAHGMNDFDPSVASYPSSRVNAFQVRCIKDQ
ncbi:MAG: hypothetical protein NTU98_11590 [Bacteroidetes bacterium]|nr:hypothetical protein [Bacteroidota bacterium]